MENNVGLRISTALGKWAKSAYVFVFVYAFVNVGRRKRAFGWGWKKTLNLKMVFQIQKKTLHQRPKICIKIIFIANQFAWFVSRITAPHSAALFDK